MLNELTPIQELAKEGCFRLGEDVIATADGLDNMETNEILTSNIDETDEAQFVAFKAGVEFALEALEQNFIKQL